MNYEHIRENVKICSILFVAFSTLAVGVLVHLGSLELVSSIQSVNSEIEDLKSVLDLQLQSIRKDVQSLQILVDLLRNQSLSLIPVP